MGRQGRGGGMIGPMGLAMLGLLGYAACGEGDAGDSTNTADGVVDVSQELRSRCSCPTGSRCVVQLAAEGGLTFACQAPSSPTVAGGAGSPCGFTDGSGQRRTCGGGLLCVAPSPGATAVCTYW